MNSTIPKSALTLRNGNASVALRPLEILIPISFAHSNDFSQFIFLFFLQRAELKEAVWGDCISQLNWSIHGSQIRAPLHIQNFTPVGIPLLFCFSFPSKFRIWAVCVWGWGCFRTNDVMSTHRNRCSDFLCSVS